MQNTIYRKCSCLAAFLAMAILAGCSGGGSNGGSTSGDRTQPSTVAGTEFADLNPTNAGYAAIASSRAADARPRPGSITQSSNVHNGITADRVTVTAQHGAGRNSYSIRNGTLWSVGTSDGSPVVLDVTAPFDGQELHKRIPGGLLYANVYSDIEAPSLREVGTSSGTPVRLEDSVGSTIRGLTLDEINARMGDGELDGVPGTFSCDRAGGGSCPAFFGTHFDPTGTDWIFTPHGSTRTESTPDTDYLAGGIWMFVPDNATSADDFVFGAFLDGNDPFHHRSVMALQGMARYNGAATGIYTYKSGSDAGLGYWNGKLSLDVDFGGGTDLGTIGGSVTGIEVDDDDAVGSLTLGTANIGGSDSGFFEGNLSGTVNGIGYTGRWGGQFFGTGEADGEPGSVGGTLGGRSEDRSEDRSASFVGAFAAYK